MSLFNSDFTIDILIKVHIITESIIAKIQFKPNTINIRKVKKLTPIILK